jgi:hypothetical protein
MFTVCVLFYGDYPALAQRCLGSVLATARASHVAEIRIGFNEVSKQTRRSVHEMLAKTEVPVRIYDSGKNVMKYPLMRRMFYDDEHPIESSYLMWFDDDSCLTTADVGWWAGVAKRLKIADMLGHVWVKRMEGNQREGIKAQPWYNGKLMPRHHRMKFATGGWWAARKEIILDWNYPWPALHHNGGDSTLGEMIRQQGYKLVSFKDGLWINADDKGTQSGAKRRGVQTKSVWHAFHPDYPIPDLSHHDFDIEIYDLKDAASEH